MAITTGAARYYKDGAGGVSAVVGYESKTNRVARYQFTAPSTGAYGVTIRIGGITFGDGDNTCPIRFRITAANGGYENAGADDAYDGTLTLTLSDGSYTATGTAKVLLLPNQSYELWVFPGSTSYGWWYWNTPATLTEEAGAGLVYIHNGTTYVPAIPYIHNGTTWVQALPYIYDSGKWTLCS